jgi:hypothetical protein
MNKKIQLISTIVFILLAFNGLKAQNFDNFYDARSEALGRTMSVLDGSSSIYGNPSAGLSANKSMLSLGAQTRFLLTDVQMFQVGYLAKAKKQSFGFASQYFGNQYLKKWTVNAQYARKIFEKLDAGIRLRGGQLNLDVYGSRFTFDADLGIQAKMSSKLSFGALVQNLMRFQTNEQEQAGTLLRVGVAYLPSKKVKMNAEVQQDFNTGIGFNAGVEYLPNASFRCRIGTQTKPLSPSFGVGYVLNNRFVLDSFASYHPNLGLTSGLNLGLFF